MYKKKVQGVEKKFFLTNINFWTLYMAKRLILNACISPTDFKQYFDSCFFQLLVVIKVQKKKIVIKLLEEY